MMLILPVENCVERVVKLPLRVPPVDDVKGAHEYNHRQYHAMDFRSPCTYNTPQWNDYDHISNSSQ